MFTIEREAAIGRRGVFPGSAIGVGNGHRTPWRAKCYAGDTIRHFVRCCMADTNAVTVERGIYQEQFLGTVNEVKSIPAWTAHVKLDDLDCNLSPQRTILI